MLLMKTSGVNVEVEDNEIVRESLERQIWLEAHKLKLMEHLRGTMRNVKDGEQRK